MKSFVKNNINPIKTGNMSIVRCVYKYSLFIFVFFSCIFFSTAQNTSLNKQIAINQILSRVQVPEISSTEFNIKDFGAIADGKTNCIPAIEKAIKKAVANTGGKVIIPDGEWFCKGPIHLEDNINLHLKKGSRVVFSDNDKDYLPLQLVRWEGVEIYNYSPYIYAKNKKNIAITGHGTFDGNAEKIRTWRKNQKPAQNKLREMGKNLVPVDERRFGEGHFLRFSFIQLMDCKNILIENITIENVPFWVMHPTYSKNITIRNVTVTSPHINNDGIDFDSCEDALVENCVFTCGDDAIVIKSGRDNDAWRINKPSKNIVIRNCLAPEVLHGLAFGSEMSGGIENIFIDNFYMKKVKQYAIQFKANRDRGGYIKNIFIDGIFIDSAKTALFFTNDYHGYSGGNYPSEFHHITIDNVFCSHANGKGIEIMGLKEKPIHNIRIKNFNVLKENSNSSLLNVIDYDFENVLVGHQKLKGN